MSQVSYTHLIVRAVVSGIIVVGGIGALLASPTPAYADITLGLCTFDTPFVDLAGNGTITGYSGDCSYEAISGSLGAACIADRNQCDTPEKRYVANGIERGCSGIEGVCPSGFTEAQKSAFQGGKAKADANVSSCLTSQFDFVQCVWRPFTTWFSALLLTIGGGILLFAGNVFDTLIQAVIINFGYTLQSFGMTTIINGGWTLFRDISNIFIIGVFTFISISIILGLQDYGRKKLIANVLIVAILINFSLLFTKIIIDVSNFTAYAIYEQLKESKDPRIRLGNNGISAAFLEPMGIKDVWKTEHLTEVIAKQPYGGGIALLYGLLGMLVLIAAAAVLLYGSFLIIARAVLFVFLMLTAALAFATYLLPKFAESDYGWNNWWKALLNGAIFAPLLMLFLALSVAVLGAANPPSQNTATAPSSEAAATTLAASQTAQAATAVSGGSSGATASANGSLSDILLNPHDLDQSEWRVMIVYLLGIGMLFASMKLANNLAGRASGFNLAQALTAAPFTLGSRFLAAPIGRRFGGAIASSWAERRVGRAQNLSARAEGQRALQSMALADAKIAKERGDKSEARAKMREARAAGRAASVLESRSSQIVQGNVQKALSKAADGSFNIMQTKLGRAATSGLPEWARGAPKKDEKGYESFVKEGGSKVAKIAEKAQPGAEQRNKVIESLTAQQRELMEQQRTQLRRQESQVASANKQLEKLRETLQQHAATIGGATKDIVEEHIRSGAGEGQMRQVEERIRSAAGTLSPELRKAIDAYNKAKTHADTASASRAAAETAHEKAASSLTKSVDRLTKEIKNVQPKVQANIVTNVAKREYNYLGTSVGIAGVSDDIAKKARGTIKTSGEEKNLRKALEKELEKIKNDNHHT